MTASWGGVGVLWGKNVVFTITFFGENCREALALCGKVSGRDGDKIKEAGLTPYFVDGTTAFEEAEMIFVCRKLYADTITFFGENCREALALCGKVSGRDGDKIKEAGLTPYFVDGTTAFEEAEMIFVCRKLYADEIKPEKFIATENDARWYPEKDYHTMYIAEITKVLVKEA